MERTFIVGTKLLLRIRVEVMLTSVVMMKTTDTSNYCMGFLLSKRSTATELGMAVK